MMYSVSMTLQFLCVNCSDCWSPVCVTGSKPSPREAHTLTALDEKRVILCGGFDGKKRCNDVWLFDIDRKV